MMRHDRKQLTNEQLDRYADAIGHSLTQPLGATREGLARAVLAVADAEQAEMIARHGESVARLHHWQARAEAAEAEVERLRAEIRDRESERADLRDRAQKAEAQAVEVWDEGYIAGHMDARAVQPAYPTLTANPHRRTRHE